MTLSWHEYASVLCPTDGFMLLHCASYTMKHPWHFCHHDICITSSSAFYSLCMSSWQLRIVAFLGTLLQSQITLLNLQEPDKTRNRHTYPRPWKIVFVFPLTISSFLILISVIANFLQSWSGTTQWLPCTFDRGHTSQFLSFNYIINQFI